MDPSPPPSAAQEDSLTPRRAPVSSDAAQPKVAPPPNIQEAKTVQFGPPPTTSKHKGSAKSVIKAKPPTAEDWAKTNCKSTGRGKVSVLNKEPGWRLSSSSKLKMNPPERTRSPGEEQGIKRDQVKSDTSISSNGPLKEFFRTKRKLEHQPKVHFDPNPKLVKEALEVSATLEKLSVRERQSEEAAKAKSEPKSKQAIGRDGSAGKLTCPLDLAGGYIGTSLDHIKLITYYDDDDTEETVEKSNKSGSSKRRKTEQKSSGQAKDQDESRGKSPPSSDSSGSDETK